MARLHEYQGKAILAANGSKIPRGRIVGSEAEEAMSMIAGKFILKMGRKSFTAAPPM